MSLRRNTRLVAPLLGDVVHRMQGNCPTATNKWRRENSSTLYLKAEGYGVIEATDGEEAMILVAEEALNLIILEWMVPNLSGIEVCRHLRTQRRHGRFPFLC